MAEGKPAQVLADAANQANLPAIDSHGTSRAWHQLVGSTAEDCVRVARCPVVMVPLLVLRAGAVNYRTRGVMRSTANWVSRGRALAASGL